MVLNFLTATVVGRLTEAPPVSVQKLVDHIRVPSGAGAAHAH